MKNLRLQLLALTLVNLGLFVSQIFSVRHADAGAGLSMLRGTGMEIDNARGRVRAQIKVEPANPNWKSSDGQSGSLPETVIFWLITPDGKPRVKVATSEVGSGLMLLGDSDTTHTILQAERAHTSLKLRNNEATQQVLKP